MKKVNHLPRDPRDINLTAPEQQARRIAENEDAARGGSRVFGQATAGAEGKEGKAGTNGATWYSGTTVPSLALGLVGDFYLRTTTSDVYKKTGEAIWTLEVNIKGSTGGEGPAGTNGKEGPAGSASNSDWKNSVRAATTANVTISTALNPTDVLDGVTLVENDRVLVKNQTTKAENGIWVVKAVPVRAEDADAAAELSGGSTIYVEEGTRNKRRTFQIVTPGNVTPGTTAHEYLQLGFKDFGIVEALPTTEAVKNDKCTFKVAAGIYWDLIYTEEATYPWAKIGGPPLRAFDVAGERATTEAAYQTTGAPTITLPAIKVEAAIVWGARHGFMNPGNALFMAMFINSVEKGKPAENNTPGGGGSPLKMQGVFTTEASQVVATKYKVNTAGNSGSFRDMYLEVDPLRVG